MLTAIAASSFAALHCLPAAVLPSPLRPHLRQRLSLHLRRHLALALCATPLQTPRHWSVMMSKVAEPATDTERASGKEEERVRGEAILTDSALCVLTLSNSTSHAKVKDLEGMSGHDSRIFSNPFLDRPSSYKLVYPTAAAPGRTASLLRETYRGLFAGCCGLGWTADGGERAPSGKQQGTRLRDEDDAGYHRGPADGVARDFQLHSMQGELDPARYYTALA
ncbi:hypothetical protein CALVIDRAFT_166871 [Calocera viscosa TUFC12733]|uniref:Trafficking protein particle complex subunit n=1 Tax=Calocera viscosa (strain TUFC12733) TaxID=1330018 RepID=A0A167L4V3_CALVF|nr:hypothetical protein CALVIDRAFT_166871 [Calocera viscosa TUFC12733]